MDFKNRSTSLMEIFWKIKTLSISWFAASPCYEESINQLKEQTNMKYELIDEKDVNEAPFIITECQWKSLRKSVELLSKQTVNWEKKRLATINHTGKLWFMFNTQSTTETRIHFIGLKTERIDKRTDVHFIHLSKLQTFSLLFAFRI